MIQVKTPDGHTIEFPNVKAVREYMNGHGPAKSAPVKHNGRRRGVIRTADVDAALQLFIASGGSVPTRALKRVLRTRNGKGMVTGLMSCIKSRLKAAGLEPNVVLRRQPTTGGTVWHLAADNAQVALREVA